MQVALTGLSQSGKSTLFAAITEGHTHSGHGSHQLDKAIVKVPDERLAVLSDIYKPKKTTAATIEFLDLPGLDFTDDSHKSDARKTIAQARQADMLVIVLRAFQSNAVASYRSRVDPAADLEELQNELLLADLDLVTNRIEKLRVSVTKPTKNQQQDKKELVILDRCSEAIENIQPLSDAIHSPEEEKMLRSFGFLTLKPICVVVNVDEDKITNPSPLSTDQTASLDTILLAATIEAEIATLDNQERPAFLEDMGLTEIARDRLVHMCYKSVNLISFLTVGADEVRAWTVPARCHAVDAAGEIHSDIQRGFIRAETVHYDDLIAAGDMKNAKAMGKARLEGKNYEVKDGDIINFRFNV